MRQFSTLFFFFFCSLFTLIAQQDSLVVQYDHERMAVQEINEEDLGKFKDDPKFDYELVETDPSWWNDFKAWLGNLFLRFFEWIFGVEQAAGALATFLKALPYVLLAVLLYILIRFFLNVSSGTPANHAQQKPFVELSEEEHIIKNEDIQVLIQKALDDKNYRLAVRYYYLYMLQLMTKLEVIDWQLQKTNHDYENEIKKPDLKKDFTKITRLYDYVWYGDFEIDELQYQKAENIFSTVKQALKK